VVAWIKPVLKKLYDYWMAFAAVLGWFMSRLILTIMFVLIFTPVGVIMFIVRADPLERRPRRGVDTYWKKRTALPFQPEFCRRQF
jgi:multisubunit Na+/H+ antiporter MnhG subunit